MGSPNNHLIDVEASLASFSAKNLDSLQNLLFREGRIPVKPLLRTWIWLILFVGSTGFIIYQVSYHEPYQALDKNDKEADQILDSLDKYPIVKIDSLHQSLVQADLHNSKSLEMFYQLQSSSALVVSSDESNRTQTRVIYATALAGLISGFYLFKDSTEERKKSGKLVAVISVLFIVLMYGLEVNSLYLGERRGDLGRSLKSGCEKLVNLRSTDSSWYVIDYTAAQRYSEYASRPNVRQNRKTYIAFHPDLERSGFYWGPLVAIFFFLLFPPQGIFDWRFIFQRSLKYRVHSLSDWFKRFRGSV